MKNRKRLVSVLAGVMAAVLLLTLLMSILPTFAGAASSGEIRKQIIALQQERKEVQNQIADVKKQYKENENEIADLIAKKNVIDQEIQLLNTQIININEQISAYNLLIADKQDELDTAEDRLETLNQENKDRIRTMEEEGEVSYWEVVFKANSFSDLLDRLNMVEEIAASDKRRLQELFQDPRGRVFVVELPFSRTREECRLAYRLFSCFEPLHRPRQERVYPERGVRFGPLPGDDRN